MYKVGTWSGRHRRTPIHRIAGMTENAITMSLEPSAPRQLGEEGLIILWRDGMKPERREGLACILSICPHPECTCQLVYVDGFVIGAQATEVRWDQEGVHPGLPAGSEPARTMLDARMIAIVDPSSGDTEAQGKSSLSHFLYLG